MNTADRELMQAILEAMEHLHRTGDTQVFDMYAAPEIILALRERLAHCDRCGKRLGGEGDIHTCTLRENKRFEQWWDAGDDIPNDAPYTPDTPIQFAWAGWQAALAQPEQEPDPIGDAQDRLIAELAAQPEQEPVATVQCIKGITIDPVTGNVGIGTPAQPEQEPVKPTEQEVQNAAANLALMREMFGDPNQPAARVNDEGFIVETGLLLSPGTLLYTTPPVQPEQEPVEWLTGCPECGMDSGCDCDSGTCTPPAAQRKPQYNKTEMNCFVQNLYDEKMREGKHGHYESMFHVVHRAIEAAHGIKENT
jgi:hypothetical protein